MDPEVRPDADPEALAGFLGEIHAGNTNPWLLVGAGDIAAQLGQAALAEECFARLDPLSEPARELRQRLSQAPTPITVKKIPRGLQETPNDLVAHVFQEVGAPSFWWQKTGAIGLECAAFLVIGSLTTLLPDSFASVMHGALVGLFLFWSVRLGAAAFQAAWDQMGREPHVMEPHDFSEGWKPLALPGVAFLAVAAPLLVGFAGGLTWTLVLMPPAVMLGILLLSTMVLDRERTGWPFATPPNGPEIQAFALIAFLTTAGALSAGVLVFTGLLALVPFFLLAALTWTFACRATGRLAQRVELRIEAELRRSQPLLVHEGAALETAAADTATRSPVSP